MKLILVMVSSLDGKTTFGEESNNHSWTSHEDQEHFKNILEKASLLIMGSGTYEPAKGTMIHREGRKRIVITRDPTKYSKEFIKDQLEFTNENPNDLIKRLENEGYLEGFIVGGAKTNTEFFKNNLISEIWQTVEPKILGQGNGIIGDEKIDISLSLLSLKKLNEKGTILLKYTVGNPNL